MGWFLKMRFNFPHSPPVVNQSSVLHQKLLSLLGPRVDLAGQQPTKADFFFAISFLVTTFLSIADIFIAFPPNARRYGDGSYGTR